MKRSEIIHAIEHDHNLERWFGKSVDQSGTNWATEALLSAFQAVSGDNDFGTAVKVLGSTDTPNRTGKKKFDLHRLLIVETTAATTYIIRFIYGTGDDADVEEALGHYTDSVYIREAANGRGAPCDLRMIPVPVGTKIWAKVKNASDSVTLDFYVGLHEYN
jgi:hypothetical protein